MDINLNYQPKQLECRKALEEHRVVLFGGARGGGKSYCARNIAVEYALTYPGIVVCILRKTFPELEKNHIEPFFTQFPGLTNYFFRHRRNVELPNGSLIKFAHCKTIGDVSKHQGAEYQLIIIDEAGDWSGEMLTRIRGSNRSSNPGFPVRMLLTGNPGGEGHEYLKRLFVQRQFIPPEKAEDYFFVPAYLEDNPALLSADPEYRSRLEQEPNEAIRRAWLFGDWNIFSGQFFKEWRREKHVIENLNPDTDLKEWRKFGAMDWGFYHPTCFLWFAQNMQTGEVIVYREFLTREETPQKIRAKLLSFQDTSSLKWIVGAHDMWNRQKDGGPSIEYQFRTGDEGAKLFMIKANTDRVQGWSQVRAYLSWDDEKHQGPKLKVCRSCQHLIEGIPRMQHHRTRPEDVALIPYVEHSRIGEGEDQVDALRYGLMSLPPVNKVVAGKTRHGRQWLEDFRRPRSWQTV